MTLTAENIVIRSGTLSLTLFSTAVVKTTTFTPSQIGKVKIDFNNQGRDNNIERKIFFTPSSINLSFFDTIGDGDSLFETLDSIPSTTDIVLTIELTTRSGSVLDCDYIVDYKSIKTGYRSRITSFTAISKFYAYEPSQQNIFDNYASDVETYNRTAGDINCMPMGTFITNTLKEAYNPTYAPVTQTYTITNATKNYNGEYKTNGVGSFVVSDTSSNPSAITTVLRMLALEGSVLCQVFNEVFAVHRLDTSQNVALSTSDVELLEPSVTINDYREIAVIGSGDGAFTTDEWAMVNYQEGSADNLNDAGDKKLEVFFTLSEDKNGVENHSVLYATYNSGTGKYEANQQASSTQSDVYVSQVGGVKEGEDRFSVDDNSGGSAPLDFTSGDLMTIEDTTSEGIRTLPAIVNSQTASEMILDTGCPFDINDGARLYKTRPVGDINSIAQDGVNAYKKAFSADNSRRIKLVVLGLDKIKGYESFTLDSSFPSYLQNTYRPSSMSYDIINDKIEIEAYQI